MSKASEIIPDIHHKMSKKIAQLTKVIYMLNTKNEDHQAEVDAMTANHQMEIQEILSDAASKINKFKDSINLKQSQMNQDAMLEKLQKKSEVEKQSAIQEFQSYKLKMKDKQEKLSKDYKERFDSLQIEINTMNTRFKEKISTFETINKDLKNNLEEAKKNSSNGLSDLKKKYEIELAEHIRESNEKYQNMLLEQLSIQEKLKTEHNQAIENIKINTRDEVKNEYEKLIGQLRAQLSGDKQESLMSLKREWEEKLQNQRDDLSGKLEKAITDIRKKDDDLLNIRNEHTNTVQNYENQLKNLQKSLSEVNEKTNLHVKSLQDTLEQYKTEISKLKAQCIESQEEITRQEQLLSDKNTKIHELEVTILRCKDEVAGLTIDLQNAQQTGAASANELQSHVLSLEKELTKLRGDLSQSKTALSNALADIATQQTAAQKAAVLAEKAASAAQKEIEKLTQQLNEAKNSIKNTGERASDELTSQRKLMAEREENFRKELADRETVAKMKVDAMEKKHQKEIEGQISEKKELEDKLRLREIELLQELEGQKRHTTDRITALSEENTRVELEMVARHKDEVDKLKDSISQMTAQLQELSHQLDGDKINTRTEITQLETKAKGLQAELDTKKRENERAESVCTGLKAQVESLRDELKASQKALREKMEASLAKLDADWQKKTDELKMAHEKTLISESQNHQLSLKAQYDELTERYEADVAAIKSALQKESNEFSNNVAESERTILRLQSELREERTARQSEVTDLTRKHQEESQAQEERMRKELDSLRKELMAAMERKDMEAHSAQEAAQAALQETAAKKLREALEKAASDKETALSLATKHKLDALAELTQRLNDEKAKALSSLQEENKQMISALNTDQDKKVGLLNQDIEGLKKALAESQKAVSDGQIMVANERQERARREESYILGRDQLLREHEQDLRKEKERHDKEINDVMERAAGDARAMKQEFKDEKMKFEEFGKSLQQEISRLERKIRDRESRVEDLQRIKMLEEEIEEKDVLVQKAKEEMLYFKRELVNREENYNKKFNANPNVGVMQVLKTKDADTSGHSKKPPRRPSVGAPNGGTSASTGALGLSIGGGKSGHNSR